MPTKKGAGGKNQEYDATTGRYVGFRQNTSYAEIIERDKQTVETHGKKPNKSVSQKNREEKDSYFNLATAVKGKPMSHEEANGNNPNPTYRIKVGSESNCFACCAAYIMRKMGYDVEAKLYNKQTMYDLALHPFSMFDNVKIEILTKNEFEQTVTASKDDYLINYNHKGSKSLHVVVVFGNKKNKKVYDAMTGRTQNINVFCKTIDDGYKYGIQVVNTKNLAPNKRIERTVKWKKKD